MRRASLLVSFAVSALAMCAGTSSAAQWLDHPTPGIPRTADGKPNLNAPAPRTPDGKPDLSGLWNIDGLGFTTNITDVEMRPAAQQIYKQRLANYGADDPVVACLPEGPRTSLAGLDPLRIVQSPNLLAVLYETGTFRQIFTDGRSLPKDPNPAWMGYSIGHWEADTLVVETAGYNDKTWLDFSGHPHSESLKVTERYRRKDFGHMQLDMTFDDPVYYAKPWTISVGVSFMPDTDLIENVCLENEKDRARLVGKVEDERRVEKKVAASVLSRYVGSYDFDMFGTWTVSANGDQLLVEMPTGGGKQAAFAQSDDVFVFPPFGGTLKFVKDAKGVVTNLVLTIVEGDFRAQRKQTP